MADELPITGLEGSPESFGRSLEALKAHLAEMEAAGDPVPVEAVELVRRLEELTQALSGLADTLGQLPPPGEGDAAPGPDAPKR